MQAPGESTASTRRFAHEPYGTAHELVWDTTTGRVQALAAAPALARAFERHHGLAAAVARRVGAEGVRAHGVFVVHPKGFHRHERGASTDAARFDAEVDAADLGACLVARSTFESVRGDALLDPAVGYGGLALLTLTLDARRRGLGRVVACASATVEEPEDLDGIVETHGFGDAVAAAHAGSHLGFSLESCDLDSIAAGTALAWNAAVWGEAAGFDKYEDRGAYHWDLYASHDAYRRRADALVGFLASVLGTPSDARIVADIGAGDGLFAGLVARLGHRVVAIDPEPAALAAARGAFEREGLGALATVAEGTAESIPMPAGGVGAALLLDVIEHLRNPPRALREIMRALAPGAPILVSTPNWRHGHRADPVYHLDEYREEELVRQLRANGLEVVQTARIRGVYDDIVALARRPAS